MVRWSDGQTCSCLVPVVQKGKERGKNARGGMVPKANGTLPYLSPPRVRDMDEECVVCLEPTASRILPCMHAVCAYCARRWIVEHKNTTCPTCRGTVASHTGGALCTDAGGKRMVRVPFDWTRHHLLGACLLEGRDGFGVPLSRDVASDLAITDSQDWDITHVNYRPFVDSHTTLAILAESEMELRSITLTLRRRKGRWARRFVRRLFRRA